MDSGGISIGEVVTTGDKNGLRLLLSSGADVNQANKSGQTPLILAVVSGNVRLLPLLLDAGADPLLCDNTGLNAIEWAERKGLNDIASQLRQRTTVDAKSEQRVLSAGQEKIVREAPPVSPPPQVPNKTLSDDEKSKRWIAGIKQRLDEKASRSQSSEANVSSLLTTEIPPAGIAESSSEETSAQPTNPASRKVPSATDSSQKVPSATDSSQKVPSARGSSQKVPSATDSSQNVPSATDSSRKVPSARDSSQKVPSARGSSQNVPLARDSSQNVPLARDSSPNVPSARDSSQNVPLATDSSLNVPLATDSSFNVPLAMDSQGRTSSRKKCPQCNAIYDDELIAYCAFHVVPLVDINTPAEPDVAEEESRRNVLLWLLVVITFLAATLIGLILFMPRGGQNLAAVAPSSTPTPVPMWKGSPDADGSLKSKIADLPAAQTALKIEKPETVVVRVRIGNDGRVLSVQSSSANEELRRAAMDAARKATFSPDKLRARETVGTITYKFNP